MRFSFTVVLKLKAILAWLGNKPMAIHPVHLGVLYEGGNEGGVVERGFSLRRVNGVAEIIPATEVLSGSWEVGRKRQGY